MKHWWRAPLGSNVYINLKQKKVFGIFTLHFSSIKNPFGDEVVTWTTLARYMAAARGDKSHFSRCQSRGHDRPFETMLGQ